MPRSCAKDRTLPWCLEGSFSGSGAPGVVGTRSSSLDGGSFAEGWFWGSSFSSELSELLYCWMLCICWLLPSGRKRDNNVYRWETFTICYTLARGKCVEATDWTDVMWENENEVCSVVGMIITSANYKNYKKAKYECSLVTLSHPSLGTFEMTVEISAAVMMP